MNKPLNTTATKETAAKNARRQEDPRDWHFHQDKLKEITKHVILHPWIKKLVEDLLTLSEGVLMATYDEYTVRRGLMLLLLVSGNGARPHVIQNMTREELARGSVVDTIFAVSVWEHKTIKKGVALIGFFIPGLADAVKRYISVYRPSEAPTSYVFSTNGESKYCFFFVDMFSFRINKDVGPD